MSGNTEYVADANRARIMRAIVDHGPLSRVEIAQVSGLSPATVTRNVAYLMTWACSPRTQPACAQRAEAAFL